MCIVIPMLHSVTLCVSLIIMPPFCDTLLAHASIPLSVAGKLLSGNIDNVNGSKMK